MGLFWPLLGLPFIKHVGLSKYSWLNVKPVITAQTQATRAQLVFATALQGWLVY